MLASLLHGPRQVVLVTCRYKDKDNIMAASWNMPCSFNPELYAISISKKRFSHNMILRSKCFCINFVPASMKKQIMLCGTISGKCTDKFVQAGLSKVECSKISCSRLKEAIGWFECSLTKAIETGDHTIFVGKVLKTGLNFKKLKEKRLYHIALTKFVEV